MKTSRWFFAQGIRTIGNPSEGEARFVHDAAMDNGRLRPVARPETSGAAVPGGATCLFRYRGRNFTSTTRRHFGIVRRAGAEVISFSEAGSYPKTILKGHEIPLGLPTPNKPPTVGMGQALSVQISQTSGSAFAAGATLYYRFAAETAFGVMMPSASRAFGPLASNGSISLLFARSGFTAPITKIHVFRGYRAGEERLIATLSDGVFNLTDSGLLEQDIPATSFEPNSKLFQYIYTFAGMDYEGAPSRTSPEVLASGGVLLTLDAIEDGYWEQPGLRQVKDIRGLVDANGSSIPAGNLKGPNIAATTLASEEFTVETVPFSEAGARGAAGATVRLSGGGFVSGSGVLLLDPANQELARERITWMRTPGGPYGRMDSADFPAMATKARVIHGGTVSSWQYDTSKGALRVNLGANGVSAGEQIVFMLVGDAGITSRAVLTAFRHSDDLGAGWFMGLMGWEWASDQTVRWAREGLRIALKDRAEADRLAGLEDGTVVRLYHPELGTAKRVATAYLSAGVLFLQMDTTGLENLDVSPAGLELEFYPVNHGIRGRAVYRVGDTGEFLQVGIVPLGQSLFLDLAATSSLGTALQGQQEIGGMIVRDEPPPPNMRGMVNHNGSLFGMVEETIRWTPKGKPHSWPPQFRERPPAYPMGLVPCGHGLLVLTTAGGWRIDGADPTGYFLTKTAIQDGILAPGSAVETPRGVVFLGSRGVVVTDGHTARCITEDKIRPWQLFPARQLQVDASLDPGMTLAGMTRTADTSRGAGQPWVASFESSEFLGALGVDGTLGLQERQAMLLASRARGAYANGKYYLYMPASEALEGHGCWVIDLETGGSVFHLGLQPLDMVTDGPDVFLLTREA